MSGKIRFYYSLNTFWTNKITTKQAWRQWCLTAFFRSTSLCPQEAQVMWLCYLWYSISGKVKRYSYVLKQEEVLLNRVETSLKCLLFTAAAQRQGRLSLLSHFFSVSTVSQQYWKYQSLFSHLLLKAKQKHKVLLPFIFVQYGKQLNPDLRIA